MKENSLKELNISWKHALTQMGVLFENWASLLENPDSGKELSPRVANFVAAAARSKAENPWFTDANIIAALRGLSYMLRNPAVEEWARRYAGLPKRHTAKKVGIIAAGNLPMVAFHDILCTLLAGHEAVVKLSSQDQRLLPALFAALEAEIPGMYFELAWETGRLPKVDAVIATGSNNSARYFEYYFGKQPHIIRKNRNAVAIIRADEPEAHLQSLGTDIFSYFGLGCRNVSKIYVHNDFEIHRFFEAIYPHRDIVNHHKYANNYDYYKALWLMNSENLLDNGFLLLRHTDAIASPAGVVYIERYSDEQALRASLSAKSEEIQCIVSSTDVPFGKSQAPELWDFADGVDTMQFLLAL